ncbi:MAG: FecR domain-containing protein, partial [Phycisphaerae bacterium]
MPVVRKTIFALVATFAAVWAGLPAVAGEPGWKLQQAVGEVIVGGEGLKPVAVRRDDVVPLNGWVQTGKNGRAVLVRAGDTVVVAPGSRVSLPAERVNGNTQVLQSLGSVFYSISKEKVPHFQVDTPYMAAVVKGTSFIIAVDNERSRIDVTDGLVQVSNAGLTDVEYVRPGFSATLAHSEHGAQSPALEVTETSALPPLPLPEAGAQPPAEWAPGEEAAAPASTAVPGVLVVEAPISETPVALALAMPARAAEMASEPAPSVSGFGVIAFPIGETSVDVGAVSGGLADGGATRPVSGGGRPVPASEASEDAVGRDATPVVSEDAGLSRGKETAVSDGTDGGTRGGGEGSGRGEGGTPSVVSGPG